MRGRSRRGFLKDIGFCGVSLGVFGTGTGLRSALLREESSASRERAAETFAAPPISREGFAQRLSRIRTEMRGSGLSYLLVTSVMNHAVRYLGFFDPDFQGRASGSPQLAAVLLPLEEEPILFLQTFTSANYLLPRARAASLIGDVRLVPGNGDRLLEVVVKELQADKLRTAKIGIAGGEIDWAVQMFLSRALPEATIQNANASLDRLRIVKDEEEVALLRCSAAIGDAAMRAVKKAVRPGQTDYEIYRVAESEMRRLGADEDTFVLLGIGPNQNPMLMESLNSRKINGGNVVVFEVLPYYRHYNTELAVTFSVGTVSARQKKAAAACEAAYRAGVEKIRPGRPTHEVVDAALDVFRAAGFDSFTHGSGHFIGLDNYEGPPLRDPELILEPGMVFSFHPNVVIPGEVKEEISGNLLVTPKGFENLSAYLPVGIRAAA